MKKLITIVALVASFACAQSHPTGKAKPQAVDFVIAVNQDPSIGVVTALTLEEAKEQIASLASLDPVCYAVPQVCVTRAEVTVYYIFYRDGAEAVVYGN